MVHRYKYPIKIYKNTQAPQRTEADTGPRLITGPARNARRCREANGRSVGVRRRGRRK